MKKIIIGLSVLLGTVIGFLTVDHLYINYLNKTKQSVNVQHALIQPMGQPSLLVRNAKELEKKTSQQLEEEVREIEKAMETIKKIPVPDKEKVGEENYKLLMKLQKEIIAYTVLLKEEREAVIASLKETQPNLYQKTQYANEKNALIRQIKVSVHSLQDNATFFGFYF